MRSLPPRQLAKRVLLNLLVGGIAFGVMVVLDFVEIRNPPVEIEFLVLLPIGALVHFGMPVAFWYANRDAFRSKSNGELYRVILALVMTGLWWLVAVLPLLSLHIRMGGRL